MKKTSTKPQLAQSSEGASHTLKTNIPPPPSSEQVQEVHEDLWWSFFVETFFLEMAKLIFVTSAVQQVSSWIVVIIHVGANNILYNASYEDIARNIIKICWNCKSHGVNDVFISSILVKKNPVLNALIRREWFVLQLRRTPFLHIPFQP